MSCNRASRIDKWSEISRITIGYCLTFIVRRPSSSSRGDVVTNDNIDNAGRDNRKSATAGAKDGQFSGGFVTRESLHGGQWPHPPPRPRASSPPTPPVCITTLVPPFSPRRSRSPSSLVSSAFDCERASHGSLLANDGLRAVPPKMFDQREATSFPRSQRNRVW